MDQEWLVAVVFFLLGLIAYAQWQDYRKQQQARMVFGLFETVFKESARLSFASMVVCELNSQLRQLVALLHHRMPQHTPAGA